MLVKIGFMWTRDMFDISKTSGKLIVISSFWLMHLSSAMNPLLYVLKMSKMKMESARRKVVKVETFYSDINIMTSKSVVYLNTLRERLSRDEAHGDEKQ